MNFEHHANGKPVARKLPLPRTATATGGKISAELTGDQKRSWTPPAQTSRSSSQRPMAARACFSPAGRSRRNCARRSAAQPSSPWRSTIARLDRSLRMAAPRWSAPAGRHFLLAEPSQRTPRRHATNDPQTHACAADRYVPDAAAVCCAAYPEL